MGGGSMAGPAGFPAGPIEINGRPPLLVALT